MKHNIFAQMAYANTQIRGGQCYCFLSPKSYAFIMMLLFSIVAIQAQTLVNREWENLTGLPDTVDWKASLTDANGNVVIAGNTITAPGETALLLTKYDRTGAELWAITYQYNGNTKNYATAITGDANGNLFITGATSGTNLFFDFLTLSVDVNGNVVWAETYNGLSNLYDVPTAIAFDNSGNVIVVGGSYGLTTQSDYLTVKYDANGSLQWAVSYDYVGLHDAPIDVRIDPNDNIIVTGASASAINNYDYTTIEYDAWGTQNAIDRQNIVGAGLDSPLAMIRDNAGNIYITGKVQNGTNIDIRTLKLNASFALQWAVSYDLVGLEDVGNDLTLDNLGNIYVVGYATNPDGGREYVTIKYDPMGTQVWEQRMQAIDSTQKAEAVKIFADNTGKIYVSGTMEIGTEKMIVSVCYDNNGVEKWLQNYSEVLGNNDKVIGIDKDIYGSVYLIAKIDNGSGMQYAAVRYDGFETPHEVVYDVDSLPLYMDNQLIINFKPDSNALILAPFYEKRKIWGTLEEFVQADAIAVMEAKIGATNLGNSKVKKIFPNLSPNDTINISRTGRNIIIPKFWSTLLLYISPSEEVLTDEEEISDSLKTIREYISYAEPNWIRQTFKTTNIDNCMLNAADGNYNANQKSLHFNSNEIDVDIDLDPLPPLIGNNHKDPLQYNVTSDANINIEGAWDKEVGKEDIKVGIIDSGIRWKHPDFGGQFGLVVKGGWDYIDNRYVSQTVIGSNNVETTTHGTQIAGIIGAIRNNGTEGIAGIAGGDDDSNIKGVSLYDFRTYDGWAAGGNGGIVLDKAIQAITEATYGPWACDIINISYGSSNYSSLEKQVIDFAYRSDVTLIASRGNADGTTSPNGITNPTDIVYPATYPDAEIISVGASGFNGERKDGGASSLNPDPTWQSAYGLEMDVIAPGEQGMTWTTTYKKGYVIPIITNEYDFFGGTSCSAPHVTGLVALMQSNYLNNFKLAPDDNEYLIQRYANDRNTISTTGWQGKYDPQTGWGLVDATNVLNGLAYPKFLIEHYDNSNIPSINSTLYGTSNQIINIDEDCPSFSGITVPMGKYYVDIYEVTAVFNYTAPAGMILDDYWARNSAVGGMALPPFANGEYNFEYKTFAPTATITANASTATMTTYLFHIKDFTNGNPGPNIWFPGGPQFSFSLYWKQGSNEIENAEPALDFQLYPNPTDKLLNVILPPKGLSEAKIEVLDLQGRCLKTIYAVSTTTEIDIKDLSKGFYFVRLSNAESNITKPFIVQ